MNFFLKKTLGLIFLFSFFLNEVQAADITSGETVISKPVGAGILPGSGFEGTDIESSILFSKIIPFLITWGINLAMALAVIAGIFAGYLFLTAFGDEDKRGRAVQTLIYAAVGLVVAMTAYGIVYIVTRLQLS